MTLLIIVQSMWQTYHKSRLCASGINKINRCFENQRLISSERNEEILTEHNVCIETCGTLYGKWRKEKKFRSVPNGPLNFKVNYVDTLKNGSSSPVVVALHGAPGSHTDFSNLALYLHKKGARVVVPSFPDFTVYKPGIFRHSAEEKAQFIKDFLLAVSIKQIDSLVIHSSAVYPGLLLCLSQDPVIKSIVMLNPGTCSFNMNVTKRIKVIKGIVEIAEIPVIFKFIETFGPAICKIIKLPVRTENVLDPLLSAAAIVYAGIPESKENFLQLARNRFPMLYVFSEDDRLIGKECSYELAYSLGANYSDVYIYDKDGNLIQEGNESGTLKVMSFEQGSHYVLWRHSNILLETIANFITKL